MPEEEEDLQFKFLRCSCGNCGLGVTRDMEDRCLYISVWHAGSASISWRHKIRWCWSILKGTPFDDNVILDPPQVAELVQFSLKLMLVEPKSPSCGFTLVEPKGEGAHD